MTFSSVGRLLTTAPDLSSLEKDIFIEPNFCTYDELIAHHFLFRVAHTQNSTYAEQYICRKDIFIEQHL
jgi:hypothetical protein